MASNLLYIQPCRTHDFVVRSKTAHGIGLVIAIVACGSVLGACSVFEPEKTAVSDSTLVEVLIDLHLIGARDQLGYDGAEGIRDSVLVLHGITEEQFQEAISYYAEHPEEYSALYRDVLDRIVAEQSKMGGQLGRREGPVPDSVASPSRAP